MVLNILANKTVLVTSAQPLSEILNQMMILIPFLIKDMWFLLLVHYQQTHDSRFNYLCIWLHVLLAVRLPLLPFTL